MNQGTEIRTRDNSFLAAGNGGMSTIVPTVDIYEDENGILLFADMPGVSKDKLTLNVDNNILSIEGEISLSVPENLSPLHVEFSGTRYTRNFTLSNELNSEGIQADLSLGVLKLTIPKKESHKPRKITVQIS